MPPLTPALRFSLAWHALTLLAAVLTPHLWRWWLALLALNYLTVALASLIPRGRWLGPHVSRLPSTDTVHLTFDDGPDPEVTPTVLDLLDQHDATATFFCIGERVADHPDLAAEIVGRGHQIENHSHSHPHHFAFLLPTGLGRQIDAAQSAIERATGRRPRYFRAPAGIRGPWLAGVLEARGLTLASWTRRGFDTVTRDRSRVLARLTRDLGAGDIVLLHDTSNAVANDGTPMAIEVLPDLLAAVAAVGCRAAALPIPEPAS